MNKLKKYSGLIYLGLLCIAIAILAVSMPTIDKCDLRVTPIPGTCSGQGNLRSCIYQTQLGTTLDLHTSSVKLGKFTVDDYSQEVLYNICRMERKYEE